MDDLLQYYERELALFRERAGDWARQFPKIAGRLQLGQDVGADPHVERLIQGFALIAARIQRKIDDDFPQFVNAVLEAAYPHLARPVPARTIAQFHLDEERATNPAAHRIDAGTELLTRPVESPAWMQGFVCRFRTCHATDLWPLEITEAAFQRIEMTPLNNAGLAGDVALRLRLRCLGGLTFESLDIDTLRLHLHDDPAIVNALYEILLNRPTAVALTDPAQRREAPRRLNGTPQPVGFDPGGGFTSDDPRTFPGYRLLHDYFTFPEKFLFLDVKGLASAKAGIGREADLWLLAATSLRRERIGDLVRNVDARTVRLGCSPVINSFTVNGEPIRLDHERTTYPLVADSRRPWGYEVLAVEQATLFTRAERLRKVRVAPLFGRHRAAMETPPREGGGRMSGTGANDEAAKPGGAMGELYWQATRELAADGATDMSVDLVDPMLRSARAADSLLNVRLTCSNRDLPTRLPIGSARGDLVLSVDTPVRRVTCLYVPSMPIRPTGDGRRQWQLVSHLALNRLSIVDGGADALRGLLSVYNLANPVTQPQLWDHIDQQIQAIANVTSRPVVEPFGPLNRLALCRGTEVEIEFDENRFLGGSAFLLASILERFLALYAAPNSFVRLTAKSRQREGTLASWPARAGESPLL